MASSMCPGCLRAAARSARFVGMKPTTSSSRAALRPFTTLPARSSDPAKVSRTSSPDSAGNYFPGKDLANAGRHAREFAQSEPPVAEAASTSKQTDIVDKFADLDTSDIPMMQARLRDRLSSKSSGFGALASTYSVYGAAEALYKVCAKQVSYTIQRPNDEEEEDVPTTPEGEEVGTGTGWWIEKLGLPATFSTWSHVTMLHLYLLTARFRMLEKAEAAEWNKYLTEHFFQDMERIMIMNHNIQSRSIRHKYLKDVYVQWRGLLAAYDEGIYKGDAVLASAIWRNLFKAREDVNIQDLAVVVSYMRRNLRTLDARSKDQLQTGKVEFGTPEDERRLVAEKSKGVNEPLLDRSAPTEPAGETSA